MLESGARATMVASLQASPSILELVQSSELTRISHGASWSRSRAPGSYRGCMVNRGAGACSGDARGSAKGKDPVGAAVCTVISEHVTVCTSL